MKEKLKPYVRKNKTPYDALDDETSVNAACATECTGLMAVPAETEDELLSYSEVYDYGPI